MAPRRVRHIAIHALAGLLAACAALPGAGPAGDADGLRLSFEDRAEPQVFVREGPGRRDGPGGAGGLWAVVTDLPRPERALVANLETGAEVAVALFAGGRGAGGEIRLSDAAADALGIGEGRVPVRVTALRRSPRIQVRADAF